MGELRQTLHAAVDARVDELLAQVDGAEAYKTAALERELVAIDAALEASRTELRAVCEAGDDDDIVARHEELAARLDTLHAELAALPLLPHEPAMISVQLDGPHLVAQISEHGVVIAPRPVSVGDVSLEGLPSTALKAGDTLRFELTLGEAYAAAPPDEIEAALAWLTPRVHIDAVLDRAPWRAAVYDAPRDDAHPLTPTLSRLRTSLLVEISVPGDANAVGGALLLIRSLAVEGGPPMPAPPEARVYIVADAGQLEALSDVAAAEAGDPRAQYATGNRLLDGDGFARDAAGACAWFVLAAHGGNADAQCNLGWCLENGEGVAVDKAQAVEWYRKAAEQGDADAQCNLGSCLQRGAGTAEDAAQAAAWYRRAADQGHAKAQNYMGACYRDGAGVAADAAEAVAWFRRAADAGSADAQNSLAACYKSGLGVEKSDAQAVAWYRRAAEQGDSRAQLNLGVHYGRGVGVDRDESLAASWIRRAAEQGHVKAAFALGKRYAAGRGVSKDLAQAASWWRRAAARGHAGAIAALRKRRRVHWGDEGGQKRQSL